MRLITWYLILIDRCDSRVVVVVVAVVNNNDPIEYDDDGTLVGKNCELYRVVNDTVTETYSYQSYGDSVFFRN